MIPRTAFLQIRGAPGYGPKNSTERRQLGRLPDGTLCHLAGTVLHREGKIEVFSRSTTSIEKSFSTVGRCRIGFVPQSWRVLAASLRLFPVDDRQ